LYDRLQESSTTDASPANTAGTQHGLGRSRQRHGAPVLGLADERTMGPPSRVLLAPAAITPFDARAGPAPCFSHCICMRWGCIWCVPSYLREFQLHATLSALEVRKYMARDNTSVHTCACVPRSMIICCDRKFKRSVNGAGHAHRRRGIFRTGCARTLAALSLALPPRPW
jgi:hypothetical protein